MHEKYMKIALQEARTALAAGDFPVGCVLVDEKGVICAARREKSATGNELDHAEMLALREMYGKYPDRLGTAITVYSTMEPCLMCFSSLILHNIHTIVYAYEDVMGGGTTLPLDGLRPLYSAKDIEIIPDVLRHESLMLFQEFFEDERNNYWRDSLLARYTLAQRVSGKREGN